jgi:hypothetical protein
MIQNERNPSWVPLVTLFLPVAQDTLGTRQSDFFFVDGGGRAWYTLAVPGKKL